MVEPQIRYDDGAGYERYMGYWSRLAGETFLDWLAAAPRFAVRIDVEAVALAPLPKTAR